VIIVLVKYIFRGIYNYVSRSQWPCDIMRKSTAARLLRLWVRILSGHGYLSLLSVCVVR